MKIILYFFIFVVVIKFCPMLFFAFLIHVPFSSLDQKALKPLSVKESNKEKGF